MLVLLGQYFVIMRSSMVDVLTEDFITVKRADRPAVEPASSASTPSATRCCRW